MSSPISFKIGNLLYKYFFPLYSVLYSLFKNKQDQEIIKLEKKLVREGDTVLDIGANIGFYTKIFSGLVKDSGRVFSFEPDKMNFKHLQKSTKHLNNVQLFNKAVAEKTGELELYTSKELNVDHRTYPVNNFEQKIKIGCLALDDLLKGQKVDFVKIDIQGYELNAFKGMVNVLTVNKNVSIITELWPFGLRASNTKIVDFISFLHELDFHLYSIEENCLNPFPLAKAKEIENWPKEKYTNILITRNLIS